MILYPTLELQGGRLVSLNRGRMEEAHLWHLDPVEVARGFAQAGAEWMQVTDFDAIDGGGNGTLIEEIIRAAGIPLQVGGGIRTRDHAEAWLDRGAGRVVIGTTAVQAPATVAEIAKFHPDQVVISVDVFRGQVMTEGWRSAGVITPEALIEAYDGVPLAAIVITDIDADLEDTDGSLGLITGLADHTRTQVIASGLVRSLDDIARLKYVPGVAGAIIGKALMSKAIDLEEALAVARPELEPKAAFI
ncbi:MAG: 1-(5-phosphoribosyl)-5-[(5-phosphoribosylamino)methylideneamino] imidazole-4-carboxamide isomerase [Pseudomonadota bacterium]